LARARQALATQPASAAAGEVARGNRALERQSALVAPDLLQLPAGRGKT
jgi:hypothetical protein